MWDALDDKTYVRSVFEYFAELKYDEEFVCHAHTTKYKEEQKLSLCHCDLMGSDFECCEHDGDKVSIILERI